MNNTEFKDKPTNNRKNFSFMNFRTQKSGLCIGPLSFKDNGKDSTTKQDSFNSPV